MKRYLYVVALTDSRNAAEMVDAIDMLSFRHAFVTAKTESDAYDAGFKAIALEPTETRRNDYVVEVTATPFGSTGNFPYGKLDETDEG